jgi:hypothetical protein
MGISKSVREQKLHAAHANHASADDKMVRELTARRRRREER